MSFWTKFFTWWNGETFGTQFYTWRFGRSVGEDAQGNHYYQSADGRRRWVIYNGESEASRVPPEWHGWMHHTYQDPPTTKPLAPPALGAAAPAEPDRQRAAPIARRAACSRSGRRCRATTRPGSRSSRWRTRSPRR